MAILTAGFLPVNTAQADPQFVSGTSSFVFHTDAFGNLAQSFIGSYSPSNQLLWTSVTMDNGSVVGGQSTSSAGVVFYPVSSLKVGVRDRLDEVLGPDFDLETELSFNSTTYLFPDGILPIVDPLYVDIASLDMVVSTTKKIPLAKIGRYKLASRWSAGVHSSVVSSRLAWVFLDARDTSFFAEAFARVGLQIGTETAALELDATLTSSGKSQFQISHFIEF